ncbi:MAG: hypothetical protein V1913_18075 [Fibrobacterota bacterium]
MKLYAQQGHAEGEKIRDGLKQGLIDGVILSPKDISDATLDQKLSEYPTLSKNPDLLFDPQFYACFLPGTQDVRLGKLEECYSDYFGTRRRSQLEREKNVVADLKHVLEFQVKKKPLTAIIAPNVLVKRSLDSREAAISGQFIRLAKETYEKLNDKRPLYATLAVSREAVLNKAELLEFMNELTVLDPRPDGFYLLMAGRDSEVRTEIMNADVIAAWMYINYTLKLNGYRVINGYSDVLTPFLGAVGGIAGATGWWSNLRTFSLNRFEPASGGGRLPIQRYLSTVLINRITFYELGQLQALGKTNSRVPKVLNGLPTDASYPEASNYEPQRSAEVLQTWDALKHLNNKFNDKDIEKAIGKCMGALKQAEDAYAQITIPLDIKSNADHLEALREGIREFMKMAEMSPVQ